MIAHVVLFSIRPDVSLEERRSLIDAWATALREIPSIRRAIVGQRIRLGRSYEDIVRLDFPYGAIIEFDNADAVRAYLDHPAHAVISTRFFAALADTLIYDFEVEETADGLRGMLEADA